LQQHLRVAAELRHQLGEKAQHVGMHEVESAIDLGSPAVLCDGFIH
jgi:hypothetical protein